MSELETEVEETEPPTCPVCDSVKTGRECPGCGYEDEDENAHMRIAGLASSTLPMPSSDTLSQWLDENERGIPHAEEAMQFTPKFATVDLVMTVETIGVRCKYVRQRGTEQECSPKLWSVVKKRMVRGFEWAVGETFACCTLHLPLLMTDRFVEEYSIVRMHP